MRLILILLSLPHFLSCKIPEGLVSCQHRAEVIDLTGLDGCGLLLELRDGSRLIPTNPDAYRLVAGASAMISYEDADVMTTCMASSNIVTITCYTPIPSINCPPITTISPDSWQQQKIQELEPQVVSQYNLNSQLIYGFMIHQQLTWFDCHGNLLCEMESGTPCDFDSEELSNKIDLWIEQR